MSRADRSTSAFFLAADLCPFSLEQARLNSIAFKLVIENRAQKWDCPPLYDCDTAQAPFFFPKVRAVPVLVGNLVVLRAETISGTISDPSGALIPGVRIEISGGELTQPVVHSSDPTGKVLSPDLRPGLYTLRITRNGFETLVKTVELQGKSTFS